MPGMKHDGLLTISDALEQLKKETGVAWTEAAFLSAVYESGIELQALPPITAGVDESAGYETGANDTLRPVVRIQWRMALLKSTDIKQLLLFGEAIVNEAVKGGNISDEDHIQSLVDAKDYFTSPVQVNYQMVRVPAGVIEKITTCPETWPKQPASSSKVKAELSTGTSGDDWKDKARAIANRIANEKWSAGIREITARNICEAVASELAKDITTHGNRGERSSGSIRSHALKKVDWKFIPPAGTNGTSGTNE